MRPALATFEAMSGHRVALGIEAQLAAKAMRHAEGAAVMSQVLNAQGHEPGFGASIEALLSRDTGLQLARPLPELQNFTTSAPVATLGRSKNSAATAALRSHGSRPATQAFNAGRLRGSAQRGRAPIAQAPMMAPKMARAPSTPGTALAIATIATIATIGPTEANVTPISTGNLMPNQRVKPSDWISVTRPQQNKSADISCTMWSGDSFSARPTISATATAPAYITSTCCRRRAARRGAARRGQDVVDRISAGCAHVVPHGALTRMKSLDPGVETSGHCGAAPAVNQRPTNARSASVIRVALFIGMAFSTTACW